MGSKKQLGLKFWQAGADKHVQCTETINGYLKIPNAHISSAGGKLAFVNPEPLRGRVRGSSFTGRCDWRDFTIDPSYEVADFCQRDLKIVHFFSSR